MNPDEEARFKIEPLPKQKDFLYSKARFTCYSGGWGCVAGETKIFDPLTGKHTRIDKLDNSHVYSKQLMGYGTNWATRPKIYRKTRLYKVKTTRGSSILVTKNHRFFSKTGRWVRAFSFGRREKYLLVYGGFHPLTIWELYQSTLLSSARNFWKRVSDSLKNYLTYSYRYDELLRSAIVSSLDTPPSRDDVPEYTLAHQTGISAASSALTYSHLCQSYDRAYKNGFSYQGYGSGGDVGGYNEQKASVSLSSTFRQSLQFLQKNSQKNQVLLFFQALRAGFWTWYYNNTIRYEKVVDISYERTDYYYDLHVPQFNNYFAEGFVNHNSGKTYGGCLRALMLSSYPGNFGLIGRLTYSELRDTTQRTFFELCPPEYYDPVQGGEWRRSENHLKLINGSEIIFRHLDQVAEKELLSLNLGWFYFDQAEEIPEAVYTTLVSRLRLNKVPTRYGFVTCNPEPGNWIYHRWKKPLEEGKPLKDHELIEASTYENKDHLPHDYLTSLETLPEEVQKRFVLGRWDMFEGQIYPEFDKRVHVIQPFKIPETWERLISIDHGMTNPTAAEFGAIDYDGNVFLYDEHYAPGIVSDHAKAILAKAGGDEIAFWLIDPSTQAKTREKNGMPWSVLEEYEDHGIYATPANNEMLGGINRVREFLRIDPTRRHPRTGELGSPRLFIFANCGNLINEFPQYQWKKMRNLTSRNAPEIPRDYNDHALDAVRYMIMSRFPAPSRKFRGDEMVIPWQRQNANNMAQGLPSSYQGDSMLGKFGSLPVEIGGEI